VRVVDLPGLPPKGDVSDWLDAGHDAAELRAILEDAPAAARSGLRWYSPVELATMTLARPDWIIPGYALVGGIVEIDGKIKSAGKTTFILHAAGAILDGADFLGRPTRRARVLYVTEQSRQTFADALRRTGLENRGAELRILFREDIGRTSWPEVVAAARQDGYEVVVFDTIGKLAGVRDENAAPDWSAAMTPLQDLAASGRAVVVARHDRKGGGDVGDSGRGSSQASGDVDIILALRRPEGNQGGNRRVIESLSRYRLGCAATTGFPARPSHRGPPGSVRVARRTLLDTRH
jgi:putative DNA primase/helicase